LANRNRFIVDDIETERDGFGVAAYLQFYALAVREYHGRYTMAFGAFYLPVEMARDFWSTVFLAYKNLVCAASFEQASEEQDPVSAN
jgi:hypothetical protein